MKKTKLHVEVTRFDIEEGWRFDSMRCPVALAVKRAYQEKYPDHDPEPSVGQGSILLCFDAAQIGCPTPKKVAQFITDFDDQLEVKPFEFTIRI